MTALARAETDDPATLFARAGAAERAGDLPLALQIGREAVAAYPDHAGAWFLLGVAQYRCNEITAALASLSKAQTLAPDMAEVNHTLGLVAYAHGDHKTAIAALSRLDGSDESLPLAARVEALALLANLLNGSGAAADAEARARAALALDPTSASARIALAGVLYGRKQVVEAVALARAVLEIDPDNVPALLIMAGALESMRASEVAEQFYARILTIDPEHARALNRQLDVSLTLCDWSRYDALVGQVLARVRRDIAAGTPLPFDVFNLLPLPVDPPLILAASRAAAARHAAEARPLPPPAPRAARQRLHVAYLLPYTNRHSLPQALIGVVQQHDRARFAVTGYSRRTCEGTAFSREFRASFERMVDIGTGAAGAAAELIRGDDIDILIDTTGHTAINGLDVLSCRPARIQAHYLGYGLTTGADYVDYLITDRRFLGPGGEAFISEAPVFLPHSFMATMRAPIAVADTDRAAEGLPERGVVFANFNHPCKLDPATFALWMTLLKAVLGSVLWLGDWSAGTRQRLRGVAAEHGVSPKRLVFAALTPHPLHLKRLELADIALDNRLHGGGVTTVDALWAGLPVVSLAGAMPAARLGATLLAAAGVPELVVDSVEDYVALALALARDPGRRAALRARLIAGRDTAPLFDIARQTRDLETAYTRMWATYCAGLPPTTIDLAEPTP
jgi:protein O-GlcNAc transferase